MRRRGLVTLASVVIIAVAGCTNPPDAPSAAAPSAASPSADSPTGMSGTANPPTASPAATPARTGPPVRPGACPVFPADNVWHADVSRLPVHRTSAAYVSSMGASRTAHPDFGSGLYEGAPFGIPITTVPAGTPGVRVSFEYAGESDKGPYPIPPNARIEGGPNATGDRHVILYDPAACRLYELFAAYRSADGSWRAGSGAVFDLRSNALRPKGWTSADAAGLPIMAGLVRYEEVAAGRVDHAIRLTAPRTRNAFVWPARHAASDSSDAALPAMGQRFRLRSSVDISRFPPQARVVAQALKTYGAILADNGSAWYLSGTQDDRWDNDALRVLGTLQGADFEAVDASDLMVGPDSGAVR